MIELPLTEADRAYAHLAREERESLHDYFERPGKDIRWTGLAAESAVNTWLHNVGIEATWNGGVDGLPDFEVGGVGIALKNNNGAWREGFEFVIPAQVCKRLDDQIMFTVLDDRASLLYVVGVTTNDQFRMNSRFARKGEMGPIRPLFNDCRIIRADQLVDPAGWARMMGGNP